MGPEREWVHSTQNLSALSYRFAVRTDDVSVGRQVDAALGGLRDHLDTAFVEHWYSLTASDAPGGTLDVARDGEMLAHGQPPGDALGWVVWDVNRAAADAGADNLLFHSGAVEADGTGVLLPGASGSGKSTLTAGLVRAGLGYLTDELAALHMTSGKLVPYPKPITVKPGSFAALADIGPDACGAPGTSPWAGQEWQVAVGDAYGTCDRDTLRARLRDRAPPQGRRQDHVDPALGHPGVLRTGRERGEPRRARIGRHPCPRPSGPGVPVLLADLFGPP